MVPISAADLGERLRKGELPDEELVVHFRRFAATPDGFDTLHRVWPKERLPVVGTYFCVEQLGSGVSGVVYKALPFQRDAEFVALKLLRFVAEEERDRFIEREIEILKALDCPNIARYLDSGGVGGTQYLAMELVEGIPLDDYLGREAFTLDEKLEVFQKVCEAVAGIHERGVIHRDLKPRHILVDSRGEPHVVDFGLSAIRAGEWATEIRQTKTALGRVMGTAKYMSPEQAWGGLIPVDRRADVWALGIMLFEIATEGDYPYDLSPMEGSTPKDSLLHRIQNDTPRAPNIRSAKHAGALATLIKRCLAYEPDRRLPSARELAEDIARCRDDGKIRTKPLPLYQFQRIAIGLATRYRIALWTGIVFSVTALLFLVAIFSGVQWRATGADYSLPTRQLLARDDFALARTEFRIVTISDESVKAVVDFAEAREFEGVTRDPRDWRAIHGYLMKRLASLPADRRPAQVVWDYYFKSEREVDQELAAGVRELVQAGVPVALASYDFRADGRPDVSDHLYRELKDIADFGRIDARNQEDAPGQYALAIHRNQRTYPSVVLLAFHNVCYPSWKHEVFWPDPDQDRVERKLVLRSRNSEGDHYLTVSDPISASPVFRQMEDEGPLRAGDKVAVKTFQLYPVEYWRQRTTAYEALLTMSEEELGQEAAGRILVVTDVRTVQTRRFGERPDLHDVRYETGVVKDVPGGYLLANAIKGLLGNRYNRVQRLLFPNALSLVVLAAMLGCLLAVPIAKRRVMASGRAQQVVIGAFCISAVIGLYVMLAGRSRASVLVALAFLALSLASTPSLVIEFARNRRRLPEATPGMDAM